jgi:hypothetical protein
MDIHIRIEKHFFYFLILKNLKNGYQKITLTVDNMSCAHCSGMVQKTLVDQAIEAVTKAGYPAARG